MNNEAQNPVVLLSEDAWHIVEHSRRSRTALCGRPLHNRRAHSRLRTIGAEHLCPHCRQLWESQ